MLRVVVIGHNEALYKEANCAEAITPGHLVGLNGSGALIKNATADVPRPVKVAVEQDFFSKGIDDAYAINDQGLYQQLDTGCEYMALVGPGAAAIGYGDLVASVASPAGTVIKTATRANAIGRAVEAVDNSGGSGTVRLRVEIL